MENIPNVRFKGFTDDWEQRKLIDVCDYVDYRGKTPTKTEIGIFLVTAKNVKDGYIDYESSKEYISEDDYEEVMRRGKPEIGDVLITTEAPCGNVAQVNKENIALAQRIIKYRGHSKLIDNAYLKYYLLSPEFQKVLDAKSSGGTVRGIKGSVLHQQTIQYPLYEEQVKIGLYLDNLDHLITLHQCKCDETKELKKYMLQKMFPQNGKKIPEIRFAGFADAWEQRKLSDVCYEIGDGLHSAPVYDENGEYFFINGNNLVNGEIVTNLTEVKKVSEETFEKNNKHLDDSTILLSINGTIGNLAYYAGEKVMLGKSAAYLKAKNIDKTFLYTSLQTSFIMDSFMLSLTGTTIKNLGLEAIKNTRISIPNSKEQLQIGAYFANLDNLITLHQRKCDELKEVRKFMLQNMFPQKG